MTNKKKKKRLLYGTEKQEFPPLTMDYGGYISPDQEAMYNTEEGAKQIVKPMGVGEQIGWTALDLLTEPVGQFTGKNLSAWLNPNAKFKGAKAGEGTAFNKLATQYVNPIGHGVASQIPGFGMISQGINSVKTGVQTATADTPEEQQQVAQQSALYAGGAGMGSAAFGAMGNMGNKSAPASDNSSGMASGIMGAAGSFGGTKMMKMGGKLLYQNGGNLGLNELEGPTHDEGGMTISPTTEVEGGETVMESENYVFSDTIKVPDSNKTFAQASKSIKNKYKLRPNDKLSEEAMHSELDVLMQEQEDIKSRMFDKQMEKTQKLLYGGDIMFDRNMQPVEMKSGGTIHINPKNKGKFNATKARTGKTTEELTHSKNPLTRKRAIFAQNSSRWNKKALGGGIDPVITPGNENQYPVDYMQPDPSLDVNVGAYNPYSWATGSSPYVQFGTDENQDITGNVDYMQPDVNLDVNMQPVKQKKQPFDASKLRIPNSAIAGVGAALKATQKQPLLLTPNMKMNYINTRPAEVLAEQQGEQSLAAGINALKSNPQTQGNFISNVGNLATNVNLGVGKNVAGIKYQGDVANTELANQEAQMRQAVARENNTLKTQHATANLLKMDKMIDDLSRIGQSQNLDNVKKQREDQILEMMATGIAKFDSKTGQLLVKLTKPDGTVTWTPYGEASADLGI